MNSIAVTSNLKQSVTLTRRIRVLKSTTVIRRCTRISASLDLTEDNVELVLNDARAKASFREFAFFFKRR